MALPFNSTRNPTSDLFPDDKSTGLFFLYLITHHTLSSEPFKKEKFEYALEKIMEVLGHTAVRAKSRTSPGLDLTVKGQRWSLKSEAHKSISHDLIWVSKWMELGKGKWKDDENDLRSLCDGFLHHLGRYDRIFMLRCLSPDDSLDHHYEILEIPKAILTIAKSGAFTMMHKSKQDPKPGYCRVSDDQGLMYELYFDGGSERKLQLKKLRRNLCVFHADWRFQTPIPSVDP